ncbi:immunoglobulin-like domain-containing protein [Lacinutrix iliipiscaria]|uniref:Immunoglobulin-like domain-containing protein n=1 Tax=Lacinutrix iliipiscaria TaxID=1230532 RepID=A0ABW5WQY6_9FLAO
MTIRKITFLILSLLTALTFGFTPNLVVELDCSIETSVATKTYAPPTITCPGNVTVGCPHLVPSLTPTTYDDVGVVLQTYTLSGATTGSSPSTGINDASSVTFLSGVTTVTYYVEDADGGSDSCSFNVTITDVTPPLLLCPDDLSVSNDPGECHAVLNSLGFATAWDSCSGISITRTGIPAGNEFPPGTTVVTWIVTDAAGNSTNCTQNVTVTDTEPPSLVCGPDVIANTSIGACDANVTVPPPTVVDNCGAAGATITNDYNSGGADASGIYPIGTTTVTYTATDSNGFITTCSKDIIVSNNQSPTITLNVPGPITLEVCSIYSEGGATANDPCLGDLSGLINIDTSALMINGAGEITAVGTFNVIYSIPGYPGSDETLVVNVVDTTAPIITLIGPDPLVIGDCSTYTELGAVVDDGCIGNIASTNLVITGTVDTTILGTYTLTYSATDDSGNVATSITRDVTVVDSSGPIITLLGVDTDGNGFVDDPIYLEACDTYVDPGATAIDPCFGVDYTSSIVIDDSAIDNTVLGSYFVTYEAADALGNTSFPVIREVIVIDTTPPVITLNGDNPLVIQTCDTYIEPGATATDCSGDLTSSIIIDNSTVDTSTIGTYYVTYDVSGGISGAPINTVYCYDDNETMTWNFDGTGTSPLNVFFNAGQFQTCCDSIIIYDGIDNTGTVIYNDGLADMTGVSVDAPSGSVFIEIISDASTSCVSNGFIPLDFDVTEVASHATQEIREVQVVDTILPTVICQDITLQLNPVTGTASITPADLDNGSSDNCPINLTISQSDFDCTNIGANTVTLSATDSGGNTATCDAIVTITDLSDNASVIISESATLICENDSVTYTATPSNAGTPSYQWQVNGVPVPGEIGSTFTSTTLADGDEITVLITSSLSACAGPVVSNSLFIAVSDYNPPAEAGPDVSNSVCTNTTVTLAADPVTGSGATTLWTVTSGQTSGFSFSDPTSPTSTFTGDVGETYVLTWSIDNPDPCVDTSDSMTITFVGCNAIDFDGVDDNITFRDSYNFSSAFSIEIWAKTDINSANVQTIFSKREANDLLDGYDLRVVNNIVSFNWNNGQSLSSPYAIASNTWYHIAVTYNGSVYTLYIDGVEMNSTTGSLPISNTSDCVIGAMDQKLIPPFRPLNYFSGTLDELRVWDKALTVNEIRAMMNQEVEDNSGPLRGSVVPINIGSLNWIDLYGYYQMNQATDIFAGELLSNGNSGINGRLRNMVTDQAESAPLPYLSTRNGGFFSPITWLYGNVQQLPNSISIDGSTPIDWNIVRTSHNVIARDNDIILYGLDIINNKFTVDNSDALDGQSLRLTQYLKVDGVLDLVGESQLIQDTGSIVDDLSSGVLERDQQGTTNLYNYNYWSSPVNNGTNTYTIGSVLHDGTTATNPQNILWTTSHDAAGTTNPITLSNRWLYSFENYPIDSYASWVQLDENSSLNVGLGFTMKGSGSATSEQNYVFIGKPNNGNITTPIVAGNQALIGNPYPSAIDAHEFINDNSSSTLGTLYFWEHYVSNNSHVLSDYEGGYASYNLSGGNGAISPALISGLGSPAKIPERYIPISQGFFVESNATGGTILFENDQRIFVKEAVTGAADNGSVFIRSSHRNPSSEEPLIKRLRLNFKTPEGAVRPLLLAFIPNDLATDGIDYGYDAINTEMFPNDMSWMINNIKHVIQGVGHFDEDKRYPLGMFLNSSGSVEISLQELENFDEDINVFVYDALLDSYTTLNDELTFTSHLEPNEYLNRFYITFTDDNSSLSVEDETLQQVIINYLQDSSEIYIKIPPSIDAQQVYLINILGQRLKSWDNTNTSMTNEFTIPVKNVSEGAYVIKVETSIGIVNKKVIVKY